QDGMYGVVRDQRGKQGPQLVDIVLHQMAGAQYVSGGLQRFDDQAAGIVGLLGARVRYRDHRDVQGNEARPGSVAGHGCSLAWGGNSLAWNGIGGSRARVAQPPVMFMKRTICTSSLS